MTNHIFQSKSIFHEALDAMMIVDDKTNIIDVNFSAYNLFGLSKKSLLKKKIGSILFIKKTDKQWKDFIKKDNQNGEASISTPDKIVKKILYKTKAHFLPNYNLIILRDITEIKKDKERQERFLGIASHELKSPLASISIFVELLKRHLKKSGDNKIQFYFSRIDNKINTLTRLINDFLDVTKLKQGALQFSNELFDFDTFIKETVNDLRFTQKTNLIKIKGKTHRSISGDRKRLAEVLDNLIRNALRYSLKNNEIILNTKIKDHDLVVGVQDFGTGIPKKEQKRLFDLYYRGKNKGKEDGFGLGVGLYISNEIIKKHGGKMWVNSELRKGSTFYFSLPIQKYENTKNNIINR